MMRLTHDTRLHHVALRVASIEVSAAFYATAFGFDIVREYHDDGRRVIVHLRQRGSPYVVELIERQPPTIPPDRFHLGMSTSDVAALETHLRHIHPLRWTQRADVGRERILFFRDPDGLLIEANDGLL